MIKIGITGGIGSGKTTVCQIFECLGISVYYADERAKHLMNSDKTLKDKIKAVLGKRAYHRNGRLNRPFVASQIFNDKVKLGLINKLVHPAVNADAQRWMDKLEEATYCLYEAALIVENGSYRNFDFLIVVSAPKELRIRRVMERDKVDRNSVVDRINNQLPQNKKEEVADFIIYNDGMRFITHQVLNVHRKLMSHNLKL